MAEDKQPPSNENNNLEKVVVDETGLDKSQEDKKIAQAQEILQSIKDERNSVTDDFLFDAIQKLTDLVYENVGNNEIFYLMIEGITSASKRFDETWGSDFVTSLLDKLLNFLERYLDTVDYLTSISEAILQTLEILIVFELYDELEEYAILLVNKSINMPDNLVLRTIASEATIIAIRSFGEDWNYEKTKEFDIILSLLPPKEIDGFLAGILIKGLSEEINCYGDMHEFPSMKRTLTLMKELYAKGLDFDDEFLENYSQGLVHAINWFGEAEEYEEMMVTLEDLTTLNETYPSNIDLKISLANGLRTALDHCGIMEDLDSATRLAKRMLILADELPDNKKIQSLVIMGVFKAASWAGAFWETGLINFLLSGVNKILKRFPQDIQLRILLGRGLFTLTTELAQINKEKLIKKIINELKNLHLNNQEISQIVQFYSQSLVNILYMIGEFTDNIDDLYLYLAESEKLAEQYSENVIISVSYSRALVNVIRALGLHGKIVEMEEYLDILVDYEETSENIDISIRLGKAYIDSIKIYGDINDLEKVVQLYMILMDWVDDDPYNVEFQTLLAKALVNVVSAFGKNERINEMNHYLDELREIAILYTSFETIQIQLAKGISHAIRWYALQADLKRCITLLHELRSISINFPNKLTIQEVLARSTRRIIVLAYKQDKFDLVEEMLESLRKQLKQFSHNESLQIELARALSNLILVESSKEKSTYWQSLVMELKGLTVQYADNSRIAALQQTIAPLLKD
ncbi:MAG: hypothetical protein ACTSSH_00990 [Candidatus Heimdallarchaeota archaeon]